MKYAVIAAGEGSRLTKEGNTTPKPLIEVNGERLVDRLLRIFEAQGASEVAIICNEQMTEVKNHLKAVQQTYRLPLRLVVKSTPSSMHSMWELRRWLDDGPFVLTTVDTIFREEEFDAFVSLLREQGVEVTVVQDTPTPFTPFCLNLSQLVSNAETR